MNSPFQIELASGSGMRDTQKNGGQYDGLDVLAILIREPTSCPKHKAPWIIPSEYRERDAREYKVQERKGSYWLLTVDIDDGNFSIDTIRAVIIDLFGNDQLIRIYSTGSATIDCRKWRILIPLDKPLEAARWELWQSSLNTWLIEHGITPDRALERFAQLVYLPNVPPTHRGEDGKPLFYQNELIGNDLLTESSSQTWADWLALQTTVANEHKRVAKELQEERLKNPKKLRGDSVIDEFNRNYSIDRLLNEYGYESSPNGHDWRSQNQTNKSYATRNHGKYWTSLSQSDTDAGLGRRCSSGAGCFGDAFDLFCFYEHGNDQKRAIKELTQ
jgi:Fe-S cluster biosynthesis and repair protein YggX